MAGGLDDVPHELRELAQWLVYRVQERNGKTTKVPYQSARATRRASTTDPATWGTFEAAVAAHVGRGAGDGIGFVFTPGDPFVGIDLDHCMRAGVLDERARPILERLPSYTEASPSGTGLHVIGRGEVGGGRRTSDTPWGGELEVYDRARYFTVTGAHYDGTPFEVVDLPELGALRGELMPEPEAPTRATNGATPAPAPARLDDHDVLERAFAARNGAKFLALWQGDTSAYKSQSEAELALCSMLAFYTGPDPQRIDWLFRQSALVRPKWEEARGDSTYGVDTIAKALAGKTEFYGQGTPPRRLRAVAAVEDALAVASEAIRMSDVPLVSATEQLHGRIVLERADGLELEAPSLESLATFARLSSALVAAFGHELAVGKDEKTATAHRFVAALRRHLGPMRVHALEERVEGWFRDLVRVAGEAEFDDPESKLRAWRALDELDPENTTGGRAFAKALMLAHDLTTGDRYLEAGWAHEYMHRRGFRGGPVDAVGVLEAIGFEQPNPATGGQVRAGSSRGESVRLRFWIIPADRFELWRS